ncbi:MAG: ATP-grasp ribosomal peptide maturase, partial [Candidatus Angelobacter sp.]
MKTVLMLTDRFDPTTDKVVEELNARGVPLFRCDTSEFPEELSSTGELIDGQWVGELRNVHRSIDLGKISGIYYRRPKSFTFHLHMSDAERRWANIQARMGFGGLLGSLDPWLNHPHRMGFAEYKPVQLRRAVSCGLQVPRTLVTNDPNKARAFVAQVGKAVYKSFGGSGVDDPQGFRQVFSTIVSPEQCDDPSIARTMHMFQEWIPKKYEVRLTVVDGEFFAARIDSGSDASSVDWRADYRSLTYSAIETPSFVRSRVCSLLDSLGLRYGALDLVVTEHGEWWFLECNPNGQWGWIEDETGLPIT